MTPAMDHAGDQTGPAPETPSAEHQARAELLKGLIEPAAPAGWQKMVTLLDRFTPLLTFAAVLALWQVVTLVFSIPTFLLPPPTLIIAAGFAVEPAIWINHIWATFRVATIGFAASIVIGIPLAIALANSRFLTRTLYPVLIVVQSTPGCRSCANHCRDIGSGGSAARRDHISDYVLSHCRFNHDGPDGDTRGIDRTVPIPARGQVA